jgi:hypothetical protein
MSDGGKGSSRRPQAVPDQQVQENWARIFARNPDNTGVAHNEYYDLLSTETCFDDTEADSV